jgi:D-glycero-alpha-D-manno-heptose-7-phosphate kinase
MRVINKFRFIKIIVKIDKYFFFSSLKISYRYYKKFFLRNLTFSGWGMTTNTNPPWTSNNNNEAIKFEQNILKENVGSQDQITCALGGFNSIEFFSNGSWALNKINLSTSLTKEIEDRSVLIYTGISRISSELSKNLKEGRDINLRAMRRTIQLAEESIKIFKDNKNLDEIGLMLQEGWSLKQEINPLSYNFQVQEIINRAQKAGALGGKVLGAGGGGFCLLWLKKDSKKDFLEKFRSSLVVPFSIDNAGTKIIFEST